MRSPGSHGDYGGVYRRAPTIFSFRGELQYAKVTGRASFCELGHAAARRTGSMNSANRVSTAVCP